jgi:hypothetical protein
MLYVGLDIHDKRIAICVLGQTGQIVRRAQVRTMDEMMRMLEALPDRFEVCYEASCGYGHYHDLLSPIAARVAVAHPDGAARWYKRREKSPVGRVAEADTLPRSQSSPPQSGLAPAARAPPRSSRPAHSCCSFSSRPRFVRIGMRVEEVTVRVMRCWRCDRTSFRRRPASR